MEVRDDLRYTREHEWVRREGGEMVVGVTDYAQEQLSDIVYVELPSVGTPLAAAQPFGSVEAVKAVADLYAPMAGEVTAVNDALAADPALVNRAPYGDGWMVRAHISAPQEWDALLTAEQYRRLVGELGGHGA
jgi:glycine cleavage system H protein